MEGIDYIPSVALSEEEGFRSSGLSAKTFTKGWVWEKYLL